jgi:uncharacterized membrane protein
MPLFTQLSLGFHIAAGVAALLAGTLALAVRKGSPLHRKTGAVFAWSMLCLGVSADYLAVVRPDEIANLIIGTFTIYLVVTSWLTVLRNEHSIGVGEKIAFGVIVCLAAPFIVLSTQLGLGFQPFLKSAVPLVGVVRVAIFVITFMLAIAAIGDARLLLAGGISGIRRIGRHLWRMCLGLAFAAGSAFTNGLPRLLPPTAHVPLLLLFIPQLLVLAIMIFWMVRVRFTGSYDDSGGTPG